MITRTVHDTGPPYPPVSPRATSAEDLESIYFTCALTRAGIDVDRWLPKGGVRHNHETIEAVYRYYGSLFAGDARLLWAGMANRVGPAFFAGFVEIGAVPDTVGLLTGAVTRRASRKVPGDLGFYEKTFLTMQKKIFEDQATMHQAFVTGGIAEIDRFYQSGIIDYATHYAWQQIDSAVPEAVERGNRLLLWREQRDIINGFYMHMLAHHGQAGRRVTYALTVGGQPSIPGAHDLAWLCPRVLPWGRLDIRTPFPAANIADFAPRWALIETDTFPAYLRLVQSDQAGAQAYARRRVSMSAERYRLVGRQLKSTTASLARWKVARRSDESANARQGQTLTGMTVDLTQGPAASDLRLPPGRQSRVWTATTSPVHVIVRVPSDRDYSFDAAFAALLRLRTDDIATHLVVTLPPMDLAAAAAWLTAGVTRWGLDACAVSGLIRKPQQPLTPHGRAHSTSVLRTTDGSVMVEVEVACHIAENSYVATVMFSW